MSFRLFLAIATGALFVVALELGLSVHHLKAARAATSYVLQTDAPATCTADAVRWCQAAGGLAE